MKFIIRIIVLALILMLNTLQGSENDSQKMTDVKLLSEITKFADNVKSEGNLIAFNYNKLTLYCVYDINADRVRIVSPIVKVSEVSQEVLIIALQANYHSALDARYAIGDDVVYSAFIHPLSLLTIEELQSAIRQVSTAALTFGDTYSSGALSFPSKGQNQQMKSESSDI